MQTLLEDCELCCFALKPINNNNKGGTSNALIVTDITSYRLVFRVIAWSQIVVPSQ